MRESRESGSVMVPIWLLSKYSAILTVALSLLSQQYEGSFLATKLCSQTTPVKNKPLEEEEAVSEAPLLRVPWPCCSQELGGEDLRRWQASAHGRGAMRALPCCSLGLGCLGYDRCRFCRWVN